MNNTRNVSAVSGEFCFNINYLMTIEENKAQPSQPPSFGICRLDSVIVEKPMHMCS